MDKLRLWYARWNIENSPCTFGFVRHNWEWFLDAGAFLCPPVVTWKHSRSWKMVMRTALAKLAILAMMHKGLGLRKVLKKVLKKALKKILLTQKRTQKSKCTFLSTQKSTQKFNFSECWVQKFTQKRSPKEILLKKVIYCPKLYSKKWTVFIPTYKYRWWHYPLVG